MTASGEAEDLVDRALRRLRDVTARPGATGEEVAAEARAIAASWWLDVQAGGTPPERLRLLVAELRLWCRVESDREAREWERLERAGSTRPAECARKATAGLRRAADELRLFE